MKARVFAALAAGLLFGFGLATAQMTHPLKVLGFLDMTGTWDPSLMFVLAGAVGVTLVSFRFILRRKAPVFDERFHVAAKTPIDTRLLVGSALFGIGWGIGGYCPGPAIAALAAPNSETWIFLPAMIVGAGVQRWLSMRSRR